jgi:4'-phosphopantetheinyl transferase EntD
VEPPVAWSVDRAGAACGPAFAAEAAAVATARASRQEEFHRGRACARQALARFGVPPAAIPVGPGRVPLWPDGFVGSITHCPGFCAAAVARAAEVLALGIDAEPDQPLPEGVDSVVVRPEERSWLEAATTEADGALAWDRLLFSAKEAAYKAWYPLTGRVLEFEEVSISLSPDRSSFAAAILVDLPPDAPVRLAMMTGTYRVDAGILLTTVVVPR